MTTETTLDETLPARTGRAEHVVFVEKSLAGTGARCLDHARARGYDVTLVTRDPQRYDSLLDPSVGVVVCDTLDEDALVGALRALHARRPVTAVTTTHDLYIPAAAVGARALGLPGLAPDTARAVRNKYLMRRRLAEQCPRLNPEFRLVHTAGEALAAAAAWGYPVIGKPLNANDSWNVVRLDSAADVEAYMRDAATWGDMFKDGRLDGGVLLESYVDGDEYSVETTRHPDGRIEFMGGTSKVLLGENRFTEVGISFPLPGPVAGLLYPEVAAAHDALGLDCGVAHTECRVKDGRVTILEVNARLPGGGTGSHVIALGTGADPAEQLVEKALGRPAPFRPTRAQGVGKWAILMPRSGVFGGLAGVDELLAMPGVAYVRPGADPGTPCETPPRSNDDIVGYVIAVGPTPEDALALARTAAEAASVIVLDV